MKRLAYVSGTRADFGLMRRVLLALDASDEFLVDVHATGMHLDPAFGLTVSDVDASGLRVASRTPGPMGHRDGASSARALADALNGFVAAFEATRPDAVLLLGDRGEMLAGALAALHLGIPSIHIHGGERSSTVDEPVRHAISKLATEHWVATDESAIRLERMGESVDRIHVMGAPGLVGIAADAQAGSVALASRLRARFGISLADPFLLGVFHPAAAGDLEAASQIEEVLRACATTKLPTLWIGSNADAGSAGVATAMAQWKARDHMCWVSHLPRDEFCAGMQHARVMIGNSSSGIIEAAAWSTPVLNIGTRQLNRQKSANVVDVDSDCSKIEQALSSVMGESASWAKAAKSPVVNVYGDGLSDVRMLARLRQWRWPVDVAKLNAY